MEQPDRHPSVELWRLVNGYQVSQAIHVAAMLGIADLLENGARASADLAVATGTNPGALYRLLRALASVGVFHEEGDRRFALTPLGDCLRSNADEPVGPWARFIGRPYHWQIWGELLQSVRTGETASAQVLGMSVWDYRAQHLEEGAIFDAAMTGLSRYHAAAAMEAYDFGRYGCVVDVAGGQGAFLAAILARHPATRGVLFDQPQVVARAEPILQSAGVAERCRVVGGDFFTAVPEGGDAYVMKMILHDWEDERAAAILRTCRRVMEPTAALLVVERVLRPPNEGGDVKFNDLNMLVGPGGRNRNRDEFDSLFASAGFRLVGVSATASDVSVIEGAPA